MLVGLKDPWKDMAGFQLYGWHHINDHLEVFQAIQKKFNINFTLQDIYPFPLTDWKNWLQRHQIMHTQANSILGVAGDDLQTVDFNNATQRAAWVELNFSEHSDWHQSLAI